MEVFRVTIHLPVISRKSRLLLRSRSVLRLALVAICCLSVTALAGPLERGLSSLAIPILRFGGFPPPPPPPPTPVVTASMTGAISNDVDADGKADPGDT